MAPKFILYPVFGFFVLVFIVFVRVMLTRSELINKKVIKWDFFRTFQGGQLSDKAIAATKNFANLFEMPVLFLVISILMYVTARLNNAEIAREDVCLSWIYVGLRVCHSLVHITFNHVKTRFAFYLLSNFVLIGLWLTYFLYGNF